MKNYELLDAVGGIDAKYVENATRKRKPGRAPLWAKIVPVAACLCLIVGAAVLFKPGTPNSPVGDHTTVIPNDTLGDLSSGSRGDISVPSPIDQTDEPAFTGERLSVFENSPIGIDDALMQAISASAVQAGWNKIDYTLHDEYSFTLRGGKSGSVNNLSQDETLKNTQDFLRDSGLENLLTDAGIEYELETDSDDVIALSFCYLLCDGERTGAYIRFVFEGNKVLGECQASVYASECIDSLEKLSFEEALNQAFCVENNELVPVNAADYTIKNEKLVYINGLPYYRFGGSGINSRDYIDGYALAINIDDSAVSEQLHEQYADFKIE